MPRPLAGAKPYGPWALHGASVLWIGAQDLASPRGVVVTSAQGESEFNEVWLETGLLARQRRTNSHCEGYRGENSGKYSSPERVGRMGWRAVTAFAKSVSREGLKLRRVASRSRNRSRMRCRAQRTARRPGRCLLRPRPREYADNHAAWLMWKSSLRSRHALVPYSVPFHVPTASLLAVVASLDRAGLCPHARRFYPAETCEGSLLPFPGRRGSFEERVADGVKDALLDLGYDRRRMSNSSDRSARRRAKAP